MTDSGLHVLAEEPNDEKPRRADKRKKRRVGAMLLLVCVGALVLVLALAGFYLIRSVTALNDVKRDPSLNPSDYPSRPAPAPTTPGGAKAPMNFVLLGTDERTDDEVGRSDSLMVAHLSGDRKHLYIVSFPRDMWVPIPGKGDGKINWAFAFGGAPLTVQTLEQLTKTRMDHTVAIDFKGFISLTKEVGGVTVYNPWESSGTLGRHFPKGNITVSGDDALIYVRERKNLPDGDLGRAYRQRSMVKGIVKKALDPAILANPVAFNSIIGKFTSTLTTDEALTTDKILGLAQELKLSGSDSIRLMQAPIKGWGRVGDQAVAELDQDKLAEFSQALREDTMEDYYSRHHADGNQMVVEPDEDQ